MSTSTLVPVSEYVATPYHPDCEYVDGGMHEVTGGMLQTTEPAITVPLSEIFR